MKKEIPEYLCSTFNLLTCAFPNGVLESEYIPLLFVLQEEMSLRNTAEIVSIFLKKDYHVVLNDTYGASNCEDNEGVNVIKSKMLPCGYEEWLIEDFPVPRQS